MRAIVYARLSPTPRGEESKGGNLAQQVELSEALCERKGWTVVDVISEKDTSASKGSRKGWERVKAMVKAGQVDAIVSRHYDRMYRTPRDLEDLVDLAESTGVTLAAAQAQGVLDLATPSGRLAARIGAVVARNETEMRVERQVLGHQRRRESGRPFWSTRPFGFERDGRHREKEAEALREAYQDVLAGVSLWSIAKDWNARGLLSPHGKEWRSSNLRGVLLKPRNAGLQTYSQWVEKPDGRRVRLTEETGTGNWESIVSEGLFRALVRYLSDPERNTGGGGKRKALLSGVVKCSKCKAVVTQGWSKKNAAGERYRIYTCSGGRCITCPADPLDSYVVRKVIDRAEEWNAAPPTDDVDEEREAELLAEEMATTERRTALAEMFAAGDIDASTMRAGIGRCDTDLTRVRTELADLAAKRVRVDLGDVEYLWEELDYEDPDRVDHVRAVVMQVCQLVELMPRGRGVRAFKSDHCRITFRNP
ncbi:recombinase family protein [[Kitasatospora] papulosa]|uniref:recombinase family protein n=1 Tax=Streptomyces TaxID=1883 RepID=UPI00081B89CE|nr:MULTISPECIES: recombinase family protein [Streptomyces]MCX4413199.1 recombinase family protein [[Kitasatospora] papulosa]MYX86799.1 recombinase family protein [Streptomyces sp. SID4915]SCD92622.1 Site-specific DNA recombinase [Streptomyces sp. BvitLS-983]